MTLTIGSALKDATERLAGEGVESPLLDAQLIMSWTLQCERLDVIAHPERVLTDSQSADFSVYIEKRCKRYPLAYIIGHKEFYGLNLEISDGVLVPRPETELLVEQCIHRINSQLPTPNSQLLIGDIGVGSGAIAVAVALSIPSAVVYGTEISPKAIKVARANISKYDLDDRVRLLEGDMLEPLEHTGLIFNAIVSNPPYIPTADIEELQPEVALYEPKWALDGGVDGLDAYHRLLPDAYKLLCDQGFVGVEIGVGESAGVSEIAHSVGFRMVEVLRDLAGIERVVVASK